MRRENYRLVLFLSAEGSNLHQIRFASGNIEKAVLTGIFAEHRLGLAGGIEEHVVLIEADGFIAGGAMLSNWDKTVFHLDVFGVHRAAHGIGLGSLLMEELLREPWKYCRRVYGEVGQDIPQGYPFVVTTVSRGYAREFYKKHGFEECGFDALPDYYHCQCSGCPEKESCISTPMIFCSNLK